MSLEASAMLLSAAATIANPARTSSHSTPFLKAAGLMPT